MTELWQRRLRPASFRGIPFKVESHEHASGRNVVDHETPNKIFTYSEDTGPVTNTYTVEAYVTGENYFAIRDALVLVCNLPGTGPLVHPWLGAKNVQCGSITERETSKEGRMARFTIVFHDAGAAAFPFSVFDSITGFFDAAIVAGAVLQNLFTEVFSLLAMPGFVIDSAASAVNSFADVVDTAVEGVQTTPSLASQLRASTENLRNSLDRIFLDDDYEFLAAEVDDILSQLRDVVPKEDDEDSNFTIDTASGRDDRLYVFNGLIEFSVGAEFIPVTTPTRVQERTNNTAVENLVRQLSIIKLAENAVNKEWKTNEGAKAQRDYLVDIIDAELLNANDDVFQALEDFRSWLITVLPNTKSPLASIKTYTPVAATSALLLSYELYESDDKEIDIIKRNSVRNPGFITGELEVLSD